MQAIVGNAVAVLMIAGLVAVCIRSLWNDHKNGSGCAGCSGCSGGSCAGCAKCSANKQKT